METEHQDPFAESGRTGLEKLMALGTLAEAGSRFAAERARTRATRDDMPAADGSPAQLARLSFPTAAGAAQPSTGRPAGTAAREHAHRRGRAR